MANLKFTIYENNLTKNDKLLNDIELEQTQFPYRSHPPTTYHA